MPLPIGFTRESIEIKGQTVEYRALSRSEGLRLNSWDRNDPDAAEVWMLSLACGVTEEEAQAFMAGTDYDTVTELLTAILVLSGLSTREGARDPKPHSSGR